MLYLASIFTFNNVWTIITFIYVIIVIINVLVIIHDRRDPTKALSWILVVTFLPVFGMAWFIVVGRNHRKEKIFNRKEVLDVVTIDRLCHEQLEGIVNLDVKSNELIRKNLGFITLMLNNSKSLLTIHNKVKILNNGSETFASMLDAISKAKKFIHIEFYIFEYDKIGKKFCEALAQKVAEGIEVRVIFDSVGNRALKRKSLKKIRAMGIDMRSFMPVRIVKFANKINYRNHRKIIVVDGEVAFTGGINIADRYLEGVRQGIWRDTHLRIEGEAVNSLQTIFMTDWYFVSEKELLNNKKYFPANKITNESPLQITTSGPDSDWQSIMQAYFAAINRADKYIYVSTPYLLPNQAVLTAMRVASLRGVDVRVIIPFRGDNKIVSWASYSYVTNLLEAGVRVYLYQIGFNHSKYFVIDDQMCSIGSANLDIRSFEDDFEVNAMLYDPEIAIELKGYFMVDTEGSIEVTKEMWDLHPKWETFMENLARLLSPLL